MKVMGLLMVGGVLAAGAGAAIYLSKHDKHGMGSQLPPPGQCATSQDVWEGTSAVLSDPDLTSQKLRDAADVLRNWEKNGQTYCDAQAIQASKAAIAMLEARAAAQDSGAPPLPPAPAPKNPSAVGVPPLPLPIPGGTDYAGYGWCPPGFVLNMATGMCESPLLNISPGTAQAMSQLHSTQGESCCDSCARGGPCTGCETGATAIERPRAWSIARKVAMR